MMSSHQLGEEGEVEGEVGGVEVEGGGGGGIREEELWGMCGSSSGVECWGEE